MSRNAKRRTKKYRPKEVLNPALLYDVIKPQLSTTDLDDLEMHALIALKRIENGNGTDEDIATIATVIDHAFVAAAAFEEKYDLRLLCYLALAATMAAKGAMSKREVPDECLIRIMREAVKLNRTLSEHCKRSELVEISRTARKYYASIRTNPQDAFIVSPTDEDSSKDLQALEGYIGVTFINGKVRTGYLKFEEDRGKWVWKMPHEDMQAVISEPIFVLFVRKEKHK